MPGLGPTMRGRIRPKIPGKPGRKSRAEQIPGNRAEQIPGSAASVCGIANLPKNHVSKPRSGPRNQTKHTSAKPKDAAKCLWAGRGRLDLAKSEVANLPQKTRYQNPVDCRPASQFSVNPADFRLTFGRRANFQSSVICFSVTCRGRVNFQSVVRPDISFITHPCPSKSKAQTKNWLPEGSLAGFFGRHDMALELVWRDFLGATTWHWN